MSNNKAADKSHESIQTNNVLVHLSILSHFHNLSVPLSLNPRSYEWRYNSFKNETKIIYNF